jgi:DNA polymerase-1
MVQGRKKLAIIDGKSVFYRGYYAMPGLSTKDGTPTGGIYGFAVMALEVLKRLKPDYVCVAWDKPKTNIRKRLELYPEYKAGRKPPPPDFYEQVPILHELLQAFGWPLYEIDDYEADDIMGTLAVKAAKKDIETLLVTSDLDMLQLIDPHIHVYALKKGLSNIELFHPESFEEKYGIKAQQFLDLKAIMGDSSDNIPGVAGIGQKGAIELLKEFKTLDGVYENLDLIKNSVRAKLEAGKDMAYLSKKLAAIWTDAPLDLDLKNLEVKNCDPEAVLKKLQELEFRTLVRQLPEVMRVPEKIARQSGEFSHSGKVPIMVDNDEDLARVDLKKASEIFIHTRSAGKHGKNPLAIMLSPDGQITYHIDLTKVSIQALGKVITGSVPLVGYDVKSDLKVLIELGLQLPRVGHDVLVGAFLINSLRREKTLTELAASDLGYEGDLENITTDDLKHRGGEIIEAIFALFKFQANQMADLPKITKLADDIEWPVIGVLAEMEHKGIKLDKDYLNLMSQQLEDAISDLEQQIYGYADQDFNISSPSQLAEILFEKLKLPTDGIKKGRTGYSTAASELDKIRDEHEIINFISQYREVTKLKSTYVDTLPLQADENSRVHTTFALTVAQTGRLSSHDPNLQNIPVRTDLGKKIRTAFVADEGKVFISADYSQFELRLAAYLSGDTELVEMFNRDVDVHLATAAEVYNRRPEDVSKNMRREAKVVNFGVMYGLSAHGLVQATGMSYDQASHFIKRYFEVRPKLKDYIETVRTQAKEKGYVENIFGRRRPTPDVHSSVFPVREAAYRAAVNMPFQGSAADIMKLAMVKLQEELEGTGCDLLLQIHDSVIVECPEKEAEKYAELIKQTMENVHKLPVKLTVDTVTGKNWGKL